MIGDPDPGGDDAVVAEYFVQSYLPIEDAAATLAGEQSTGTHVPVPGDTDELRDQFAARVLAVEPREAVPVAVLPGSDRPRRGSARLAAARVRIAIPSRNFGSSIPSVLAAVAGNVFELRELASVKLLDLDLPDDFLRRYPGPQFGVDGTRWLTGVAGRPLLGTIVKPSIGLDADGIARVVRGLVRAGIDFIKDDELQVDPPHLPFAERVRVVMAEIQAGAELTGRQTMYAFNLTGEIEEMRRRQAIVVEQGGSCVMVCAAVTGLPALHALRGEAAVPIHVHRAMLGGLMRAAGVGIDFTAFQKLARLCGADHLHVGGIGGKFFEPDDEVARSARALLQPFGAGPPALPVFSSGQSPRSIPPTYEAVRGADFMTLAGGGILAHPGGTRAGLEAMREAWRAAVAGVPLAARRLVSPELDQALEAFGE